MEITKLTDTTFSISETVIKEFDLDRLIDEASGIDNQIASLNNQITALELLKADKETFINDARIAGIITNSELQASKPVIETPEITLPDLEVPGTGALVK